MSIRKKIERLGRSSRASFGFGATSREKPRAMLLGAQAESVADLADVRATADILIVRPAKPGNAPKALKASSSDDCIGVVVNDVDVASATQLREAGASFVIAAPANTVAAAVGVEEDDYVPAVALDTDEVHLRSLAGLQLPAVCIEARSGLTIADQLAYVRISGLTGAPLLALLDAMPDEGALRVLRDSGAAVVVAPPKASADDLAQLDALLRALPARKRRREESTPLLPTSRPAAAEEHDHGDDDDFE